MICLALDPGMCTGYAIAYKGDRAFDICYSQEYFDANAFWRFLNETKSDYTVCESFEFRQAKQTGVELYPVELIGILKLNRYFKSDSLYFQQAHIQGKKTAYFSDQRLKEMELYRKGVEHGRSAVKHLLYWFYQGAGFQFIHGKEIEPTLVDEEWFRSKYYG